MSGQAESEPSRIPTPVLFGRDLVEKVRDIAQERHASTDDGYWLTLSDACEEMIAGERDESQIGQWIAHYQIEEQLGLPPRRTP